MKGHCAELVSRQSDLSTLSSSRLLSSAVPDRCRFANQDRTLFEACIIAHASLIRKDVEEACTVAVHSAVCCPHAALALQLLY